MKAKSKHKTELSALTINQLCQLTGRGYRTVKRRLADLAPVRVTGNAQHYDPRDALPAIYLGEPDGRQTLELSAERARLARVQADRQSLLLERERGRLVDVGDVQLVWGNFCNIARMRLLQLPYVCAQAVPGDSRGRVQVDVERIVHDALNELVQGEHHDYVDILDDPGAHGDAPGAPGPDEPVVRKGRA